MEEAIPPAIVYSNHDDDTLAPFVYKATIKSVSTNEQNRKIAGPATRAESKKKGFLAASRRVRTQQGEESNDIDATI